MRAVLVVVANILRELPFQVAFVNCDDVMQEITAATPYPTLCNPILPMTFERSANGIQAADADVSGRRVVDVAPDSRVGRSDTRARGEPVFRGIGR
jgi:hypothetical protein